MEQLDDARRQHDDSPAGRQLDRYREMAYDLIGSEKVRNALDLGREPMALRESYGMTVFGQAALAARRLVEAGSRFVTVFWDEFGLAGSGWDTHWDHYPRMQDELLPGFDLALSGLLNDLDGRGLLDETLVLVLSEHGRTPKIANVKGGGRDHWSQCYSALMAGGGIAPRQGRRQVGQDRRHRRRAADFAQGRAGDHLSPARHRPGNAADRPHQSACAVGAERFGHRRSAGVRIKIEHG